MATRETRLQRGRRSGSRLAARLIGELASARVVAGVSQRALAHELGCSQSEISRFEALRAVDRASIVRVAEVASLLGLELSAGLHPIGDTLRDRGHQALVGRFRRQVSASYTVRAEIPLPSDLRSWDLVLRTPGQLIGVEA